MNTKVRADRASLCVGSELIDVEHRKDGCAEGSEEVVLHFANGHEISVYWNGSEIMVEGD